MPAFPALGALAPGLGPSSWAGQRHCGCTWGVACASWAWVARHVLRVRCQSGPLDCRVLGSQRQERRCWLFCASVPLPGLPGVQWWAPGFLEPSQQCLLLSEDQILSSCGNPAGLGQRREWPGSCLGTPVSGRAASLREP